MYSTVASAASENSGNEPLGSPSRFCTPIFIGSPVASPIGSYLPPVPAAPLGSGAPVPPLVAPRAPAARPPAAWARPGDCTELMARIRARHATIPIGILTYANIAIARGFDGFVHDLAAAGADSLLVADIPSVEAAPYAEAAKAAGLDWVMIAATNTPKETLRRIADLSSGFTYCVARAGVTGRDTQNFDHRGLFDELAAAGAPPPILGFGISSPASVTAGLREGAAGAVCGSAIVDLLHREGPDALADFAIAMKAATRTAPVEA